MTLDHGGRQFSPLPLGHRELSSLPLRHVVGVLQISTDRDLKHRKMHRALGMVSIVRVVSLSSCRRTEHRSCDWDVYSYTTPLPAIMDPGVVAIKGYSAFPQTTALLEPPHQVVLCHIRVLVRSRESYPFAEMQSVYSAVPADKAWRQIVVSRNYSKQHVVID